MSEKDFYRPTNIDALRMENELLAFEVRFIKARLADDQGAGAELSTLKARVEELESSNAKLEERAAEAESSRALLERAEKAEKDLVLLLRRLSASPLGRILRLKESFRTLEQRYL